MTATGLGKCGLCHGQIPEMTPIRSVMLGRPPRAYICHAGCAEDAPPVAAYTVDGRGQLEPPHPSSQPSDEVKIVTSLGSFVPDKPTPAMPVKEQRGLRKKTATNKVGDK